MVERRGNSRRAFTLAEMLVAVAIIATLAALLLPAVSAAREMGRRAACANNLRQIGLALHAYQGARIVFPPGVSSDVQYPTSAWMSWCTRLLPYLERGSLWESASADYARQSNPFRPVPHTAMSVTLAVFCCPSDERVRTTQVADGRYFVGLTSYVGVAGTNYERGDGVLFRDSRVNLSDIKDGVHHTLLVGERPPSSDFWFGWWYAGVGQRGSGVPDMVLGARETNIGYRQLAQCPPGPFQFAPGSETNLCDALHFWSMHPGGGHFVFADASVRFLRYEGADAVAAMATRAGREVIKEIP